MAKYGLSILVTTDDGLKGYLANVLRQLSGERHWWVMAWWREVCFSGPASLPRVAFC